MKKIVLLIFCVSSVSFSCRQTETSQIVNQKPVVINLGSPQLATSLADNINITNVVNLETKENSIISKDYAVKRLIVKNQKIYVLDNRYNGITVFDIKGKYLYNLGKLGNGIGEFTIVQDICYYPPNNTMWVICNTPKKIIEFDNNGKLSKEMKVPFFASAMAYENKDLIYFFNNQNPSKETQQKNLIVTDSKLKIKGRLFELHDDLKVSTEFAGNLYSRGNSHYYNPPFENIVYQLTNGNAYTKYHFDFGADNITGKPNSEKIDDYLLNKAYLESFFVTNEKYLGVKFVKHGYPFVAFHNLENGSTLISDSTKNILNKMFNNSIFDSDDKFIMLYSVDRMKPFFEKHKELIRSKYPKLFNGASNAKQHDNPLLIFFNLK